MLLIWINPIYQTKVHIKIIDLINAKIVITVYPGNKNVGRSSHQGVVILFDAEFGDLLCICDASAITAQRTAAVSALAVQTFAPKHKKNLVITIMGTGEQAISHVESINSCSLSDRISKIQIWGRSEQSCIECKDHIKNQINIDVHIVLDAKEAVTSADVICTVTASRAPIVKGEWLRAGHTVIAVGACTPNARELDSKTIQTCKFFYDCKESVLNECGEYLIALEEGAVTSDGLCGEIGEVLNGNKEGRSNDDDIIVFKSLGVGIEDLFSAAYIYNNYSL